MTSNGKNESTMAERWLRSALRMLNSMDDSLSVALDPEIHRLIGYNKTARQYVYNAINAMHREACRPLELDAKEITEEVVVRLTQERDTMRNKYLAVNHAYQAALRTVRSMRPTLTNIKDAIENEGDRVCFGSTNDADAFRKIVDRLDDIEWDEIVDPAQELVSNLFSELYKTRADNSELKAALLKIASCERRAPGDVVDIARSALQKAGVR